jgi:hypothetical protein
MAFTDGLLLMMKEQEEFHMAALRTETQHAQEQIKKKRGNEAAPKQTERLAEIGHEGIRQAATASKAAAEVALHSRSRRPGDAMPRRACGTHRRPARHFYALEASRRCWKCS